jgi:hypothetical protein
MVRVVLGRWAFGRECPRVVDHIEAPVSSQVAFDLLFESVGGETCRCRLIVSKWR